MARDNGAGTWKKRSNGVYEWQVTIEGFGRKSFYGKTKKICKEKRDKFEEELNAPDTFEEESLPVLTLAEWGLQWLEAYKKPTVKVGTYKSYLEDFGAICKHSIAEMPIKDIKKMDIANFIADYSKYSASALKRYRFLLNGMLEDAVEDELITKNPARNSKLPKKQKTEKQVYKEDDRHYILEFANQDEEYGHLIYLLMLNGLRSGEVRALEWTDIHFKDMRIDITKAYKAGGELGATKSEKDRYLPMPLRLYKRLKATEQITQYVTNTAAPLTKYQFYYRYTAFFKRLDEWMEKNYPGVKIKYLSPHELRHTFASLMNENGISMHDIQTMLGHSTLEMSGHYTHSNIDKIQERVREI